MSLSGWIALGLAAIVFAAAGEAYVKRGKRRALSRSRPEAPPAGSQRRDLGMEASDISKVEEAHGKNQRKERENSRRIIRKLK